MTGTDWVGAMLGALQMKIFSHIASRRNRRTIAAVLAVKKEIPFGHGALSWKRFLYCFLDATA